MRSVISIQETLQDMRRNIRHFGNLNVEFRKHYVHIGEEAGRVGSDFLLAIAGFVGSTFRRVGTGRVQEKWPVNNSGSII